MIGTVLGTCFTLLWVSAWAVRYPRHVLHVMAASMATSMMCMGTTLHFMGSATSSCDEQLTDCKVTGSGKLGLASVVFWFLTGISVLFLSERQTESSAVQEQRETASSADNETARLVTAPLVSVRPAPTSRAPGPPRPPATQPRPRSAMLSPPAMAAAVQPVAPPAITAPRVVQQVSYQPDGTKAVTTTKSYVQRDGAAVVERTTEFSENSRDKDDDDDDDDEEVPLDAFKPHPTSQPPQPEFDEEAGGSVSEK
jgi:hypothetical protein